MYTHNCIKPGCSNTYTTEDPDPYYCASCEKQKNVVAAQIDATVHTSAPAHSALREFENKGRTMNSKEGGLATFVRAQDL